MRGPIDYIIVEFPGNQFKGDILRELDEAVRNETIALLDLALITKDADGSVTSLEISPAHQEVFGLTPADAQAGALIGPDDVVEMGELIEPNSSAGLLVIEHLWAKGLKQAIIDTGGVLVADGRIHPDAYSEIN